MLCPGDTEASGDNFLRVQQDHVGDAVMTLWNHLSSARLETISCMRRYVCELLAWLLLSPPCNSLQRFLQTADLAIGSLDVVPVTCSRTEQRMSLGHGIMNTVNSKIYLNRL